MLYQINAICWKKTVLNLKKSNKKLTLEFLYEIVFVRNGLCMNDSLACVCKNSGTTSYKKSLFEVTPMFLYEMVYLVWSGLCSKWSLYEMTVNQTCYNVIKVKCNYIILIDIQIHQYGNKHCLSTIECHLNFVGYEQITLYFHHKIWLFSWLWHCTNQQKQQQIVHCQYPSSTWSLPQGNILPRHPQSEEFHTGWHQSKSKATLQ